MLRSARPNGPHDRETHHPMRIGTDGEIRDNNGATRIRANGSSELDDGTTVGIQFEMERKRR